MADPSSYGFDSTYRTQEGVSQFLLCGHCKAKRTWHKIATDPWPPTCDDCRPAVEAAAQASANAPEPVPAQ